MFSHSFSLSYLLLVAFIAFVNGDADTLIVTLKSNASDRKMGQIAAKHKGSSNARGLKIGRKKMVVIEKKSANTKEELLKDPNVESVEEDARVTASEVIEQPNAWWGLRRSSQVDLNAATNSYYYTHEAGMGIDVYVIDTGVLTRHREFGKRARWGIDLVDGSKTDPNGHGTHVAGTIAGTKFGIAKKARIWAVRVLDARGSGWISDIIRGIDWVVRKHSRTRRKSIMNLSLGGGYSKALNDAVEAAIARGVHAVVAAGNSRSNACYFSPASAKNAITVGSIDQSDNMSSFSNSGPCVDIFAPGSDIQAAWNVQSQYRRLSGTSMAAPHVAGALAILLSQGERGSGALINNATPNKINNLDSTTKNLLLYTNPYVANV